MGATEDMANDVARVAMAARASMSAKGHDMEGSYFPSARPRPADAPAPASGSADAEVVGHRQGRPPVGGPMLSVVTLSEVTPEHVQWLWPGRLPVGKIVVLDGDPGTGKSTLALDLAAHLSTGVDWPDGTPCPIGDTVLLSAEDGLADTVVPRLIAAGANMDRVHALTQIGDRAPHLGDVDALREVIRRYQARLLVVDVLMAHLPADASRDQAVRRVLHPLGEMAQEEGCCLLLLRHLTKTGGANLLYRGSGSIGVIGASRAAFMVGRDPDDQNLLVLAGTKSNLAPTPDALAYRLISHPSGVAVVQWAGRVDRLAADLVYQQREEFDEQDQLGAQLLNLLLEHGGRAPAAEASTRLRTAGYSQSSIDRARKRLGIETKKEADRWVWYLSEPDAA